MRLDQPPSLALSSRLSMRSETQLSAEKMSQKLNRTSQQLHDPKQNSAEFGGHGKIASMLTWQVEITAEVTRAIGHGGRRWDSFTEVGWQGDI